MISISKKALQPVQRILKKNKAIFFGVKSGGCNGFEYILKPINILDNKKELFIVSKIPFVLCEKSQFLFIGTEIDWKSDYMGSRFIFNNPNSSSVCGCGSTFSIS